MANHSPTSGTAARPRIAGSTLPLLQQDYEAVRSATLKLVAPLSAEDCQVQSMPDVSPTKWHLAHTTWFFETFILERFEANFKPHDELYRVLFNSYYNGVGDKHPRPERGYVTRPSLAQILQYRAAIDERIAALLQRCNSSEFAELITLAELITIGINHEQQHQELILTDIKHVLSCSPLQPAYAARWPLSSMKPQAAQWVSYEGGLVEVGNASSEFVFDNETPRHKTYLHPYALASQLVTHGDWTRFIADDGYKRPELWLSAGWDWVQQTQVVAPLYWRNHATEISPDWHTYTLQGLVAIDEFTPICHINYFEADAFARWAAQSSRSSINRWAGARLPTEFEWEHAASQVKCEGNFVERGAFHPMPLSNAGHHLSDRPQQLFGDVWEWTSSSYAPYPGYKPWAGAVGEYNGKFMCNQYVLRGGSCATPASHIRASYRNFFPTHAQWQFSGLRLTKDLA